MFPDHEPHLFDCPDAASALSKIKAGANVNEARGPGGVTPLHFYADNPSITGVLLANKAKPNPVTVMTWQTPLMMTSNPGVVRMLLMHGADVEKQDCHGRVALHYAVAFSPADKAGCLEKTRILIEHNRSQVDRNLAGVNALDNAHRSPLHLASSVATARLLLEAGASTAIKDCEGRMPAEADREMHEGEDVCRFIRSWQLNRSLNRNTNPTVAVAVAQPTRSMRL